MSIALLVHAGDSNAWIWPHFLKTFKRWWDPGFDIPVYFATEDTVVDYPGTTNIRTGPRPWGLFIQKALGKIPEDHVLFMHSDYFLIGPPDIHLLNRLHDIAHKRHIKILKCCGDWCGHIDPTHPPTQEDLDGVEMWRYDNKSDYLTSHQESIWSKQELSDSVLPNENPWSHETNASNRMKAREPDIRIYAYRNSPPLLYRETVVRGKIREGAEGFFNEDNSTL